MKKILIASALFLGLAGCNNTGDSSESATDTGGLTNPTAIDTAKHPSGIDNSSVISTDTAAMNMQNSLDKAKEVEDKKKQ